MNERIRELAEQAGSTHKQNLGVYQFYADELEKFAELLVNDCVEVINAGKNAWTGTDVPASVALDLAGKNVKAYFGVEQ